MLLEVPVGGDLVRVDRLRKGLHAFTLAVICARTKPRRSHPWSFQQSVVVRTAGGGCSGEEKETEESEEERTDRRPWGSGTA